MSNAIQISRKKGEIMMPDFHSLDLRVIELSKSSYTDPLRDKLKLPEADGFVCLGHFDYLSVKQLEANAPLLSIKADFQKRNNYNYPLYIFHYAHSNLTVLESFWLLQSCFMTVSRIHFNPNAQANVDHLKKALSALHQGPKLEGNQPGELSISVGGELIHAVFYHTLELGDLVVVLKSNSILSCLDTIRRMMEVAEVGDVYSFCGIHSNLVQPNVIQAVKKWDQMGDHQFFKMGADHAVKQIIPHASMRFSIRSIRCAESFWHLMNCQPFFIAGTADAIIDLSGRSVETLLRYISCLIYRQPQADSGGKRFRMYDAFEDIITRIGSEYGKSYSEALPMKPRELPEALENALNKLKTDIETIMQGNANWMPILIAQVNTLSAMMESCVTDDLSMLIWPSVCALLARIKHMFNNRLPISQRQEKDIGEFLNAWDIFENDISRLEGQLSQNPELLSSRYYTPATLVAFYMALLTKYNILLLAINQDQDGEYVPLITYNVDPRASTLCILDPSLEPSEISYSDNTPLLVSLPVSMMYQPLETVIVLCHEMSHYTGTSTRHRKDRYGYILRSFAARIAMEWKLDNRSQYSLKSNSEISVINDLAEHLDKLYCEYYGDNKDYYINQLYAVFPQKLITQVFFDQDLQTRLLYKYLKSDVIPRYVLQYSKEVTAKSFIRNLYNLKKQMRNLIFLYRECYADLMATLTLDLTPDEYLKDMFYPEAQYIAEFNAKNAAELLRELQLRAAMVLYATGHKFPSIIPISDSATSEEKWLADWKGCIGYYQYCFSQEKDIAHPDDENRIIMIQAEYLSLIEYLKECNNSITEQLTQENPKLEQKAFLDIFNAVKNNFDLEKVYMAVTNYRNTLLA